MLSLNLLCNATGDCCLVELMYIMLQIKVKPEITHGQGIMTLGSQVLKNYTSMEDED